MIRCKLISPTNLMLEHPLLLSKDSESEFCVLGLKEYRKHRRECIQYGILIGLMASVAATAILTFILQMVR